MTNQMTADRAAYFMRRFKKEEKLLGPNEQAAVDYVIALLEQPSPAVEPLEWVQIRALILKTNKRAWSTYGRMAKDEEIARAVEDAHGITAINAKEQNET